jgi:hypothetical protein
LLVELTLMQIASITFDGEKKKSWFHNSALVLPQ